MTQYDTNFYDVIGAGCIRSAAAVVPVVQDIIGAKTVIDLGCGEGHWLAAFAGTGARVVGLDGGYVDASRLVIAVDDFHEINFDKSGDFDYGKFDLAVSLEVAEHIRPERADWFVDMLCRHSDVILFSAAIPAQGGTGHVNEQWPGYWVEKFAARGYEASGALRWRFWNEVPVPVENWYAQNMLLFAKPAALVARPELVEWFEGPQAVPYPVVHPVLWNCYRGL